MRRTTQHRGRRISSMMFRQRHLPVTNKYTYAQTHGHIHGISEKRMSAFEHKSS